MKVLPALICVLLIVTLAYPSNIPDDFLSQRSDKLVSESLQNTICKADKNGSVKAWVFFTDKGFSTVSEYNNQLQITESNLTERARTRRIKAREPGNLADFKDIPVNQAYINMVQSTGVKIRHILRWFNAVTIEADINQLNQIAQFPSVRMFKNISSAPYSDDFPKEETPPNNYPVLNTTLNYGLSLYQLKQINAIVAHELGFAGQDVLVCMMDTGYRQAHIAFQNAINQNRLIAQWDFINNDNNTDYDVTQDSTDQPNHGTFTWSTLGGEVANNLYGPAYKALFCLAKTEQLHMEHHWEEDNWAAGAQWADSLGADVISSSLGYRYGFDPPDTNYTYQGMNGDASIVTQAADLAAYNGITVVTAQGNNGSYGIGSLIAPADGDSIIAVGAVDEFDLIAGFSSLGPTYDGRTKPEICARGVGTLCADPWNMSGFTAVSGTSLSTPLCGGASAILLSAHPDWTPMMVREALMMTATQADAPDNTFGWGIIDVGKAMFYHPQGDIIIDHEPLVYFPSGQVDQIVTAEIAGGAGINSSEVYLCWRNDDSQPFIQTAMTTSDNLHFEGVIPGQNDGTIQYYISAEDINSINAVYPFGAPVNFFSILVNSAQFFDSFEDGLYYWKTSGTGGQWALNAEHAATGNISITDSPARFYNNNSDIALISNFSIPLVNCDSARVSFTTRYSLQTDHDFVYFEISTDNGQSWQQQGSPITGFHSSFIEKSYNLGNYLGNDIKFRFRMITNNETTREGIFIDDFSVTWHAHTSITDSDSPVPAQFKLDQNYPNPFNASTKISFSLNKEGLTHLSIYDILGRKVKTLLSEAKASGCHEVIWNGTDNSGNDVASGIYLYKLESGDLTDIKRMMLLR